MTYTTKTLTTNYKRTEIRESKDFNSLDEAIEYCRKFAESPCAAEAKVYREREGVYEHNFRPEHSFAEWV